MKFTPENLLQIYLDGSFTDEAQTAFDELMKKDPNFAEKVTQAVSERLGNAPGMRVDDIATRLDAKIDGIWEQYKPSPWIAYFRNFRPILLIATVVGLLYVGFRINTTQQSTGSLPMAGTAVTGTNSTAAGLDQGVTGPKMIEKEVVPSTATKKKVKTGKHSILKGKRGHLTAKGKTNTKKSGYREMGKSARSAAAPSSSPKADHLGAAKPMPIAIPSKGTATNNQIQMAYHASPGSVIAGNSNQSLLVFQTPSAVPTKATSSVLQISADEGFPVVLSFPMDAVQSAEVKIYNASGNLVRFLFKGDFKAGNNLISWDGKTDNGKLISPGTYTVTVNSGGNLQSKEVIFGE